MDILEKMEKAAKMPTPPVLWCGEAAEAIRRLRAALKEIRDDDAGDAAYGYRDTGMAYDRMQRIARNALLAD